MKKIIFPILLLCFSMLQAQHASTADTLGSGSDEIRITPIFHSSLVLEWDGYVILVDPYNGAGKLAPFEPANLILITHAHPDHMDVNTLRNLNYEDSKVLAPEKVMQQLDTLRFHDKIVLRNGEEAVVDRIKIEAIPMYNLPEGTGGHLKGEGNGYIITIAGKRIYIAGDTEDIKEMRQLKNIDVAFIPMNLPYTMTEEQAADAVLAFSPRIVYPFHYRGKEAMSDPDKFRQLVEAKNKDIEIRLRDWYPEKE